MRTSWIGSSTMCASTATRAVRTISCGWTPTVRFTTVDGTTVTTELRRWGSFAQPEDLLEIVYDTTKPADADFSDRPNRQANNAECQGSPDRGRPCPCRRPRWLGPPGRLLHLGTAARLARLITPAALGPLAGKPTIGGPSRSARSMVPSPPQPATSTALLEEGVVIGEGPGGFRRRSEHVGHHASVLSATPREERSPPQVEHHPRSSTVSPGRAAPAARQATNCRAGRAAAGAALVRFAGREARGRGLEPLKAGPEPAVLPITPPPKGQGAW